MKIGNYNPLTVLFIGLCLFVIITMLVFGCGTEMVTEGILRHVKADPDSTTGTTTAILGQKGDTFGGTLGPLIACLAALLTFLAFWIQYAANYQQSKEFKRQADDTAVERFENRFFKFIDYHRENVAQLKYRDPNTSSEKYWEGNQVFTMIHYEVRNLLLEFFKNNKSINIDTRTAVNFVYNSVFYGAGDDALKVLDAKFDCRLYDYIDFKERKAEYNHNEKRFNIYYSGHVRRLGHYFRNIY